ADGFSDVLTLLPGKVEHESVVRAALDRLAVALAGLVTPTLDGLRDHGVDLGLERLHDLHVARTPLGVDAIANPDRAGLSLGRRSGLGDPGRVGLGCLDFAGAHDHRGRLFARTDRNDGDRGQPGARRA